MSQRSLPTLRLFVFSFLGFCLVNSTTLFGQDGNCQAKEEIRITIARLFDEALAAEGEEAGEIELRIEAMGKKAVPFLLEEVNLDDYKRCYHAIACLHGIEELPKETSGRLIAVLQNTRNTYLCAAALRTLSRCYPGWAKAHQGMLAELLDHPDRLVRADAIIAVSELSDARQRRKWHAKFLDMLRHDPDLNTRRIVASNIVYIAPGAPDVVNALQQELDGPIAGSAIEALGAFGSASKPAIPRIVEILNRNEGNFRSVAIETLERIGPVAVAAVPALIASINDGRNTAGGICPAIRALGEISPESPAVVEAMRIIVRGEGAWVKDETDLSMATVKAEAARTLTKGRRRSPKQDGKRRGKTGQRK